MTVAALTDQQDPDRLQFAFSVGQILGHFDYSCILLIEGSLTEKIRELVTETVRGYLDEMASQNYQETVRALLTDSSVCKNLRDFALQHERAFRSGQDVLLMLRVGSN